MTLEAPPPVRPRVVPKPSNGFHPPPDDGHVGGNGHGGSSGGDGQGGGGTGWPGEGPQSEGRRPAPRRSVWPLLLDLGLAMALFGLIITGRFLIVVGAVLAVVALAGWIREARADYARLKD